MSNTQRRGPGRPPIEDDPLVQINIRLTEKQLALIEQEGKELGRVGRNAVIRRAVDQYFARKT